MTQRRDLEARTLLLADSEGAFYELVKPWIGAAANPPKLELAGSVDGVKRGVAKGEAIGVLPDYAVAEELSSGSLVALEVAEPLPPVSLRLTTLTPPPPGSPLESLAETIRAALGATPPR